MDWRGGEWAVPNESKSGEGSTASLYIEPIEDGAIPLGSSEEGEMSEAENVAMGESEKQASLSVTLSRDRIVGELVSGPSDKSLRTPSMTSYPSLIPEQPLTRLDNLQYRLDFTTDTFAIVPLVYRTSPTSILHIRPCQVCLCNHS